MTVHQAFIRPAARPALAPILFPDMPADVRHLLPRTMDDLIEQRRDAERFGDHAALIGYIQQALQYYRFAVRLNARIAQVAK